MRVQGLLTTCIVPTTLCTGYAGPVRRVMKRALASYQRRESRQGFPEVVQNSWCGDENQRRYQADRIGRLAVGSHAWEPSSVSPPHQARDCHHRRSSFGGLGPEVRGVYTETGRAEMSKYAVFFEPASTGFSAHVPDLPGCVAAASTLEDTRQLIRDAIEFHVEGMRMNGEIIPAPTPHIEEIEVAV